MDEEKKLLAKAERQAIAGSTSDAGWGAALVCLVLPKNVCELPQTVAGDPAMARDRAIQVVRDHDEFVDSRSDADATHRVRGIVHTGFRGIARALVVITITPSDKGVNYVLVRGVSKRGAIKGHSHENAAHMIAEALPQTIPEYGTWPS
jgi:hypothetical protein